MRYRTFGRLGWQVSEIGYGMWGLAGWTGSDDDETRQSLQLAVELGCNFFDTALAYGEGHSEPLLGELVRDNPGKGLIVATKIPPKNRIWPSRRGFTLDECFPPDYIRDVHREEPGEPRPAVARPAAVPRLGGRLGRRRPLAAGGRRPEARGAGRRRSASASTAGSRPTSCATLRTGLIDAVQVIYNIFDQAPEDELFPACRELDVAVIARVPFDEGTLTGTLTKDSQWPEGDWRNTYFVPENLIPSVERAERLKPLVPAGMTMPELALRFILSNPDVATVIPGMRQARNVGPTSRAATPGPLPAELLAKLKEHRWERTPTDWSQ